MRSPVAAEDGTLGYVYLNGTLDENVHVSNTLQLAHALQRAGKPFRLMLYPKSRHGVTQKDQRTHLWRMITDFVLEKL